MISPDNKALTIEEQCFALGLPRSTYYYRPLYNGPLKLDTRLRQKITLNFVVRYGKDITQKVHA